MPEPEHSSSLAFWDLTAPVVVGRPATLKVGVACASGCNMSGCRVDVYNDVSLRIGSGMLGPSPWPATAALYWSEIDIAPPQVEGDQLWRITATTSEPTHAPVTSVVRVVACRPPEHRVTVRVIDKNNGAPVAAVELRLGTFRATTNAAGLAHIDVPGGTYEVGTWKIGYDVVSTPIAVASDTIVHLELTAEPEVERPYWM